MSDNLEPGRTDMFVPGPHDNAEPHESVRESALGSRALFPTSRNRRASRAPTKRMRPCVRRAVRRRAPAA